MNWLQKTTAGALIATTQAIGMPTGLDQYTAEKLHASKAKELNNVSVKSKAVDRINQIYFKAGDKEFKIPSIEKGENYACSFQVVTDLHSNLSGRALLNASLGVAKTDFQDFKVSIKYHEITDDRNNKRNVPTYMEFTDKGSGNKHVYATLFKCIPLLDQKNNYSKGKK